MLKRARCAAEATEHALGKRHTQSAAPKVTDLGHLRSGRDLHGGVLDTDKQLPDGPRVVIFVKLEARTRLKLDTAAYELARIAFEFAAGSVLYVEAQRRLTESDGTENGDPMAGRYRRSQRLMRHCDGERVDLLALGLCALGSAIRDGNRETRQSGARPLLVQGR